MPISHWPSVKTGRKSKRTSTRNRLKDWTKSWLEFKAKCHEWTTRDLKEYRSNPDISGTTTNASIEE